MSYSPVAMAAVSSDDMTTPVHVSTCVDVSPVPGVIQVADTDWHTSTVFDISNPNVLSSGTLRYHGYELTSCTCCLVLIRQHALPVSPPKSGLSYYLRN